MKENNTPDEDIRHIREIMERSTTFVSLTGWSGIVTGLVGIVTFYLAYRLFGSLDPTFETLKDLNPYNDAKLELRILAGAALAVSFISSFVLTWRRARKKGQPIWDSISKRLAVALFTPLIVGGLFIVALIRFNAYEMICPAMLIFFGLALLNSGKYTKPGMTVLASVELILGLIAAFWLHYGLIFWVLGFGLAILIYGIVMYLRYER